MSNKWISVKKELPPENTMLNGFSEKWVNEDFNPEGIRECWMNQDNIWCSSEWNNDSDSWDVDDKSVPEYWQQRIPPIKKKVFSTEPTESDLKSERFKAVWNVIRKWDIDRGDVTTSQRCNYQNATGTDVMTILNAIDSES